MLKLLLTSPSGDILSVMLLPVLPERKAFKILNVVVPGVTIYVMDLMAFWNWSFMKNPYVAVKPMTSAAKIPAMCGVGRLWIASVSIAIEDYLFDNCSGFFGPCHKSESTFIEGSGRWTSILH